MGCHSSKDLVTSIDNGSLQNDEFAGNSYSGGGGSMFAPRHGTTSYPGLEHIDLNDPEVQKAAAKIQAGFRGLKVRREIKDTSPAGPAEEAEDLGDIDLTDPDLADAALKIQAGFRGHKARKVLNKKKDVSDLNEKLGNLNTEEEELDIDLSDPDLNKAATKIQATFRGHRQRATDTDTH